MSAGLLLEVARVGELDESAVLLPNSASNVEIKS